jgi:hypothetical protein
LGGCFGKLVGIYIVLVLWIIRIHFNALRDYLKPRYSDKPIDSFIQVIMIVLWAVGITVIISKLFDINQKNFDDSGSSFGSYYLDFLEIPFWDLCRAYRCP